MPKYEHVAGLRCSHRDNHTGYLCYIDYAEETLEGLKDMHVRVPVTSYFFDGHGGGTHSIRNYAGSQIITEFGRSDGTCIHYEVDNRLTCGN